MIFGEVPIDEAEGAILAHSITADGARLKKGEVLSAANVAVLTASGVTHVVAARPGDADVGEDEAAGRLAAGLQASGMSASAPFTGRVNLFAETAGVLRVDRAALSEINGIDEAITVATLPDYARVTPRQMLATVKIIPYAAPLDAVRRAEAVLSAHPAISLHPFTRKRATVFLTQTQGMKDSLVAKGGAAVEARLAALGISNHAPIVTAHETEALASALRSRAAGDLIVILGGSATSDRRDVAPAAVVASGGVIERFGMPVDPGNLLFTGYIGETPVVGLPGCARSPKLNGADWVLERLAARLDVTPADIAAMGVGGLLKEIPSRPQPRAGAAASGRPLVAAILLAAGSSRRMGGEDKLTRAAEGAPLIRRSAERLIASSADEVVAVVRPGDAARRDALAGLNLRIVENPLAAEGMGASIRVGMAAIAPKADAVLIALADMPDITARDHDALIAAFDAEEGREIVRAADAEGRPGNPVLFGRRFFEGLRVLEGDEGARHILATHQELSRHVRLPSGGARTDLDTPADWRDWEDRSDQG